MITKSINNLIFFLRPEFGFGTERVSKALLYRLVPVFPVVQSVNDGTMLPGTCPVNRDGYSPPVPERPDCPRQVGNQDMYGIEGGG